MNVVVIGLGSMGKRRIRCIKELYPEYRIYGVESKADRRKDVEELFGVESFSTIGDVNREIDCAFVCTSPLAHASIITQCLQRKWHVFTELNLVSDAYDENMSLAHENGCKLFLSSPFLYQEDIKYIRERIDGDRSWNYIYHIGQYLPDWHPWESYENFFVADKRSNGCREILAVELPWLTETFGDVEKIHAVSDKMSGLNISYNDNFIIQLMHENGNKGALIVDVVSPCAGRKLEVYAEGRYYSWEGTPESLREFNAVSGKLDTPELFEKSEHMEGYSAMITENVYKREIKAFFEYVLNNTQPVYSFEKDKKVLQLIDNIGA